ncbi:MAG: pantetheine-phosphate adenylyltransferase [Candidatus Omnitrophica bacterium]|nr:pantetheine-phosphate adenylyltransferase [Candidatus Omnitrophota bacterium]
MKKRAIYPGTFDPITNGHLDVIQRALELFDTVYVAVVQNVAKKTLFSSQERLVLIKQATSGFSGLEVEAFDGLVVDFAAQKKVRTIIRGLRAISDFDYEFQMALTNRKLCPIVETIFLMPSEDNFYISSKLIKEIATLKGNVSQFVPPAVVKALKERLNI